MLVVAISLSSLVVYYEFGLRQNIKITSASGADNVSGWAWNSNIGWISLNCTNDSPACSGTSYGVNVDAATGNFSGYAWSSGVGWINFAPAADFATYPGCGYPNAPCNSAKYNSGAGGEVVGWAKIPAMGDDGWLKLSGNKQDGQPWLPGVSIDPATGNFSGWAWNANNTGSGIGWISFTCDHSSDGTLPPYNINSCGTSNYKVAGNINRPPTIANMTAPNWKYTQASANALHANLQFDFIDSDAGSFGSAYQLVVTKADNTPVLDTGKCTGFGVPSANCKFDNSICLKNGAVGCINAGDCVCQYPLEAELNWNTGYKWSVKVWDNYDVASALTAYATNPDTDNNDGVIPTFTTYLHKFPLPSATFTPTSPSKGEEVKFIATSSQRFFSAPPVNNPILPVPCTSATCDWAWTIPGNATIDDAATSTPIIVFGNGGANSVTLRVTDKTDTGAPPYATPYYSEIIIPVNVNVNLPKWKEVKPE